MSAALTSSLAPGVVIPTPSPVELSVRDSVPPMAHLKAEVA